MENKITPSILEWTSGKVKGFKGKDLISTDNGGVKLVKVSPMSTYPEHVHPDKLEYVYVVEGHPEFVIDGEEYTSDPEDFFNFPAGKKHSIINKTEGECLLLVGAIKK